MEAIEESSPEVQADLPLFAHCMTSLPSKVISWIPGQTIQNTWTIDGHTRTFRIYVPSNYNTLGGQHITYSVVFMFHGRGQQSSRMLVSTSWNQEAEDHDLIIVYPQAESYDLNKNCPTGVENKTAWDTPGIRQQRVSGQYVHDDVKFVKEIRNSLMDRFRTDCDKFYAAGFSNGGAFVKSILRVEMDYAWKATFSCGGIGLPGIYLPDNGIRVPHWEIIGNRDLNARRRYLCPSWDKCCTPGNLDPDPNNWSSGPFWYPMVFLAGQCGIAAQSSNITTIFQPSQQRSVMFFEDGPDLEYKFKMLPQLDHEFPGPIYASSASCVQCVDHTSRIWNWMQQF